MISDVALRLLAYNVGASILAGLLMAITLLALSRILGVTDAGTRYCLLGFAMLKSILVFVGLLTILPIPGPFWESVRGHAVPLDVAGPLLLLWVGGVLAASWWLRSIALRKAEREQVESPARARIDASIQRVLAELRRRDRLDTPRVCCTDLERIAEPRVFLTLSRRSPAVMLHENEPVLLMPAALVALLDNQELDGVVAHELGHLLLPSRQGGCTPTWAHAMRWSSPVSLVIGRLLDREQELACDEVATSLTGAPEVLASALLKTYRFRQERRLAFPAIASQLLPEQSLLKERVERLGAPDAPGPDSSPARKAAAWGAAALLFCSSI